MLALAGLAFCAAPAVRGGPPLIFPEQRRLALRTPEALPHAPVPTSRAPETVAAPQENAPAQFLPLDEALRIALQNSEVVRLLAGFTAVNSGRSIYDVAIVNTQIDRANARFDPTVSVQNRWDRVESQFAQPEPGDPSRTRIDGLRTDNYAADLEVAKTLSTGGVVAFGAGSDRARFQPGLFPLNPQGRTGLDVSVTQPLWQGAGRPANLAPIVLARIDTERSFFQYKAAVQEMVRGVIEGYWSLVFARTELWARTQQVEQAQFAYDQTLARQQVGDASGGDVAQTRLALANFKATLVAARANVLQREAALRNLLGLPPYAPDRLTPTTPPTNEQLEFDWNALVTMAETYRPDLIELKLVLEADQQLLIQARNQTGPRVDALALYRWNGLDGTMPIGDPVASRLGEGTDWTLGVNFSVPLGLRQARAQLRQTELLIARDRANLEQGVHAAVHDVALSLRNLAQFYAQYQAYQETRSAARDNLEQQMERYRAQLVQYLNVLQAITDWGNAVSAEAQALAQYNIELAQLAVQTGSILETHGIYFFEERFAALAPLSCLGRTTCYPEALPPTENESQYPAGDEPSEEFFDLEDPMANARRRRLDLKDLPPLPDPMIPSVPLQQPDSALPAPLPPPLPPE